MYLFLAGSTSLSLKVQPDGHIKGFSASLWTNGEHGSIITDAHVTLTGQQIGNILLAELDSLPDLNAELIDQ